MAMHKGESRDFLEPITSAVKRKKFCTVDIESKDGEYVDDDGKVVIDSRTEAGFTRPFLIGAYDPLRRLYFDFRDDARLRARVANWQDRAYAPDGCIGRVMAFLLSPAFSGYTIYAHNGGGFDHLFWLKWLRDHEDEYGFEVVPVQSSIQVIKVWRHAEDETDKITERWTLLDSMKLFPTGLEKMCTTFGLPGKTDQDLFLDEDDPSWSVYLKQDCIALADCLTKIHDLVEGLGGEVGMTTPSTSMKLFRRRFLGKKGSIKSIPRFRHFQDCEDKEKCMGCAHDWIRRGYYGGRTEPHRMYGEDLHYYDLNSSYVAAMREDMPVGERMVTDTLDWEYAKTNAGFVECSVFIPEDCEIPPLPHRAKDTGKLIFPTGRFSGVWSTKELELLDDPLVNGKILSVTKVVWFRLRPLFREMVDQLWKLRDKSLPGYDEGLSAMAKLLGNGLYGKFAMKQDRMQIVISKWLGPKTCLLCRETIGEREDGAAFTDGLCAGCEGSKPASDHSGEVWYQKKKTDAAYIIPQISAHITTLARIALWKYMKEAILAGGKIYYCDTDSIITDVLLPTSSELGALKDEYPGKKLTGTFVQPKVYMLESEDFEAPKVTMKGFPYRNSDSSHKKDPVTKKACDCSECIIRCKANLLKLRAGETLAWKQLEKVRTLAALGFKRGPLMREVKKSFKGTYDKRIINEDGLTTRAVVLDEVDAQGQPYPEPEEAFLEAAE